MAETSKLNLEIRWMPIALASALGCGTGGREVPRKLSSKAVERRFFRMKYTSPKPEDFRRLKDDLNRTGEQMAELFGVAGGQQWRKYTGGETPREMSPQILFFGAAQLALSNDELERVLAKMREIGAEIDLDEVPER
jgi:hypothetical protein